VLRSAAPASDYEVGMLRNHGRYDYSNITERPDYSWPDGKRLAVYVAFNVEASILGATTAIVSAFGACST